MKSIQQLREERNTLAQDVHALVKERKDDEPWTKELQAQYDEKMTEIDNLNLEIGNIERYDAALREEASNERVFDSADKLKNKSRQGELFNKWVRGGDNALSNDEWGEIRNALSTGVGSEGGYTVQTEVAKTVADALKAFGGMREVGTVFQTASGNPYDYPTSDGTTEEGEQIGENTTATDLDPVVGTTPLAIYKYSSKVVAAPFELLQDSEVDVEGFINGRMTQRIGRITNKKFTIGTGTGEPKGIVTAAVEGKVGTTGQTVTVIYDDLVDLVHSVDPAYRAMGKCKFKMNDASLKVIRKLKDTAGRPIFLPGYDGLAGPMPDTLLGYEISINQDVATMAANAKSILFGDFSYYYIRDVMQYTMFRFIDSVYAKLGQVGFLMWARSGGTFVDVGGAVKYYQNSAT